MAQDIKDVEKASKPEETTSEEFVKLRKDVWRTTRICGSYISIWMILSHFSILTPHNYLALIALAWYILIGFFVFIPQGRKRVARFNWIRDSLIIAIACIYAWIAFYIDTYMLLGSIPSVWIISFIFSKFYKYFFRCSDGIDIIVDILNFLNFITIIVFFSLMLINDQFLRSILYLVSIIVGLFNYFTLIFQLRYIDVNRWRRFEDTRINDIFVIRFCSILLYPLISIGSFIMSFSYKWNEEKMKHMCSLHCPNRVKRFFKYLAYCCTSLSVCVVGLCSLLTRCSGGICKAVGDCTGNCVKYVSACYLFKRRTSS